jgi:hypothetical protein
VQSSCRILLALPASPTGIYRAPDSQVFATPTAHGARARIRHHKDLHSAHKRIVLGEYLRATYRRSVYLVSS